MDYITTTHNIMPNTYNISRLEPLVRTVDGLENAVVSLVVGMTASDEGGRSAYIDTMVSLEVDKDNFVPFEDLDLAWATAHAEKCVEDNGWKETLDKQLEAAASRPVSKPFVWQTPEPSD